MVPKFGIPNCTKVIAEMYEAARVVITSRYRRGRLYFSKKFLIAVIKVFSDGAKIFDPSVQRRTIIADSCRKPGIRMVYANVVESHCVEHNRLTTSLSCETDLRQLATIREWDFTTDL